MASYLNLKQNQYTLQDYIIASIIVFLILWDPIQLFILKIDGAGRFPNFLSLVGFFLISKKIKYILSLKAVKVYSILSLYMFINAIFKGSIVHFYDSYYILFFTIFRQQILMWMVIYLCQKDLIKTVSITAMGYLFFVILCIIFVSNTSHGRLGDELDSNNIGIQSCFAIGFLILSQILKNKKVNLHRLSFLCILPIFTIILTGSRTAFILLALILFGYFLLCMEKKSLSQFLIHSIIILIMFIGVYYVIEHTTLGERLLIASTQMEGYTDTIFDKLGDRGPQYYFAWPLILENFFTGIGLRNYISEGETGLVLHSEILVQFCENGIIGLLMFLLFYCILYKELLKCRHLLEKKQKSLQANTFSILFLVVSFIIAFVMWTYSFTFSFSLFGILIALINREKNIYQIK